MRILYCSWYENSERDMKESLDNIVDEVVMIRHGVREYLGDNTQICKEIESAIIQGIDTVITFDFFPVISAVCEQHKVRYISWVYDWPNYTLFSREAYNSCNRIYMFERDGIRLLSLYHIKNIEYMSLAVNTHRLDNMLGCDIDTTRYEYDVSFIGNVSGDINRIMLNDNIPLYYKGYIDALSQAQQQVYGVNLINEVIDKDWVDRYLHTICADMDNIAAPREYVIASQICKYTTGIERKKLLTQIAEKYQLDVFTGNKELDINGATIHGSVDYCTDMSEIFRKSRINMNITLRSISSGIPLRVYDILGAGGFCLTNYQEDVVQLFKDGEELVVFTDQKDMLDKIEYYLNHEEERKRIAKNGYEAVKKFSYDKILSIMLDKN